MWMEGHVEIDLTELTQFYRVLTTIIILLDDLASGLLF
jgi:hypothetical protein